MGYASFIQHTTGPKIPALSQCKPFKRLLSWFPPKLTAWTLASPFPALPYSCTVKSDPGSSRAVATGQ